MLSPPSSAAETDPRSAARPALPATLRGYQGPVRAPLLPQWPRSGSAAFCIHRDANSNLRSDSLGFTTEYCLTGKLHLRTSPKHAAILLLPIAIAACADSDDSRSITYTNDRGVANQPYPNNYRTELLAFMKTYLNDPRGVHDAAMADPVQRAVGGRQRYVTCLRFTPANPTAAIASRANARLSMSMAGSTV